jgi:hypothetical protein
MVDKKQNTKATPKAFPKKTLKGSKKLGDAKLMYNPFN